MNKKPIVWVIVLLFLLLGIIPITSISKITSSSINCLDGGWEYDEETGTWSIEFSAVPLNESFTTKLYMEFVGRVAVIFSHEYYFPQYADGNRPYVSRGIVEISRDSGETWEIYDVFEGNSSGNFRDMYSVIGQFYRVRFTVEGVGDSFSSEAGGFWRIWDIELIGDTRGKPPKSTIGVSGLVGWDQPWNPWIPKITIESYDSNGIKEIHYVLDRKETIVSSDIVEFTITTSGIHDLAYWAVDNIGNEEVPHVLPPYQMDLDTPTVEIKKPEPGLYLFGRKMPFNIDNIIFIGDFSIEANASDPTSGIYKVTFYLNDERIGTITEEPFKIYCNIKHRGSATLKVIAEDFGTHVVEDTLDIVYYNFL